MISRLKLPKFVTKENVIIAAKAVAVICAFLAFALSMRQKEFDRFSQVKPLFEIVQSKHSTEFGLVNHGGLVYFAGCENSGAGKALLRTPRQYSTLASDIVTFNFSQPIKDQESIVLYYRDIDLNTYKVKVTVEGSGFYIDGVPLAYRSNLFCSMSRKWIDCIVSTLFPKDWFEKGKAPSDENLIIKFQEI